MRPRSLFFVAALLVPTPCLADVPKQIAAIDATLKACIDKDGSNLGMKMCTSDADAAADRLLNAIYRSNVEQLKKAAPSDDERASNQETLKRLVASERAWIAYRDADCDLQGTEMLGGSGESLVIVDCVLSMTKQRAKSLDDLFSVK